MSVQLILFTVSILSSVIFNLILMFNINTKKIAFIKNDVLWSILLTVVCIVFAIVISTLNDLEGMKAILCKVAAYIVPVSWFCVVYIYRKLSDMKKMSEQKERLSDRPDVNSEKEN